MYIEAKFIPSERLHVCKTQKMLTNFTINTTYKQPILLIFRPLSEKFYKSGRDRKNWLSYSNSAGELLSKHPTFTRVTFFFTGQCNMLPDMPPPDKVST